MGTSRRIIATILIVLGALVAFLGVTSLYLRTAVLSAETFADNTEQTLQSPQVQTFLASSLADQLAEESPELEAARPLVQAVALGVIGDPTFQSTFRRAVLTLHQVVLDGKGEEAILDLQGAVTQIQDAIAIVDPELAAEIDRSAAGEVNLGEGSDIADTLRDTSEAADTARDIAVIVPIVAFVLLALGIGIAVNRWRALFVTGVALAIAGIVTAVLYDALGSILADSFSDPVTNAATEATYDQILGPLTGWGAALTGVGVLAAALSRLLGGGVGEGGLAQAKQRVERVRSGSRGLMIWAIVIGVLIVVGFLAVPSATIQILVAAGIALLIAIAIAELAKMAQTDREAPTPS